MSTQQGVQGLQRFTTRFIPTEDRMQLAGELPGGQLVVLWLPLRLWRLLLPHLFVWLEKQVLPLDAKQAVAMVHHGVQQSFALSAARHALLPQAPIEPPTSAGSWLVNAFSVVHDHTHTRIVFQQIDTNAECVPLAALQLSAHQLRQWLLIVHGLWRQAEWPQQVWPSWWDESGTSHCVPGHLVH